MSKQRQIGVTFTKRNIDLLEWATHEADRQRRPLAWIGQDAFECYRLAREIWGDSWQQEMTSIESEKAIEAGKRLIE